MYSYWDILPEEICIEIYKINHMSYMKELIDEIKMKYNKHNLFEYYNDKIINFWYIGVGLKSLRPEHWMEIKNYHKKYKSLYKNYKRFNMI